MKTKETKKISIAFGIEDAKIIQRLVHEQVGKRTISSILNERMSVVFDYYCDLFSVLHKVYSHDMVNLTYDEYQVLASLISKAYNSENEPEKEAIKAIADAIDMQHRSIID